MFCFLKMGYANPDQTAGGIHTRLFSRAFIVDDGSTRVVFVSADIGMVSQRLRLEVIQKYKEKSPMLNYNSGWFISHTDGALVGAQGTRGEIWDALQARQCSSEWHTHTLVQLGISNTPSL